MALGELDVRFERRFDELRVGARPLEADDHTHVPSLDKAEPAGAPRDLRELPGEELTALLAVELDRLGEEQRLAGEVDAVPQDVGGGADRCAAGDEAVDLLPPRRERHRAVEAGDCARVQLVQLAREADHRAAAEGHDDRAGAQAGDRAAARPVERSLALEEADLGLGKRVPHERQRLHGAEQQDVPVFAADQEARPR
jgi:hypothetical protein